MIHTLTRSGLLLATLATLATWAPMTPLAAQDDEAAAAGALIERFRALDFRRKAVIVRTLQRQLASLDDPALRRVAAWRTDPGELPEAPEAAPVFSAARFASDEHRAGRAPSRRPHARDSAAYRSTAARFDRPEPLPTLHRAVRYDWVEGRIVRLDPLGYDELFANAAHGFAPGTDEAVAGILARLDRDPGLRRLGWWFGHTYSDLEARSYPGITLYDAWYSGEIVDVPDVDAIPFAWEILGRRDLRSPLSGAPRDRLYQQIHAAALRYRKHRTTREAAAAAYVRGAPEMDPTYAPLVPRFHYLFATRGDDVDAVTEAVATLGRDGVINEVDAAVTEPDGEAWAIREGRRAELLRMERRIRALAAAALERFDD